MGLSQGFCILVCALISTRMCSVEAEEKVNNTVDKLVGRALRAWSLPHLSFDKSTFAKGSQPAAGPPCDHACMVLKQENAEAEGKPAPMAQPSLPTAVTGGGSWGVEHTVQHTAKAKPLDKQSIITIIIVAVVAFGLFLWKARQYITRKTDLAAFKESLLEEGATQTGNISSTEGYKGGYTKKEIVSLGDDAGAFPEFTAAEQQANSVAVKAFLDDLKAAEEDFGPPVPAGIDNSSPTHLQSDTETVEVSTLHLPARPPVILSSNAYNQPVGTRVVTNPVGSAMLTPQLPTSNVNPAQQPLYAPRGVVSKSVYSSQSASNLGSATPGFAPQSLPPQGTQTRSYVTGVSPQPPAPQARVRQTSVPRHPAPQVRR